MDSLRRSAVQNTADSIKQEEMGLRAPADGSGRIYPSEMMYAQFKKWYQYFASPFTKAIAVMPQYDVYARGLLLDNVVDPSIQHAAPAP